MSTHTPGDVVRIGNVLVPTSDMRRTREFYTTALGLAVKFADGDRFVALDGGSTTLALVSPEEDVTSGRVAASFKVADVHSVLEAVQQAGGTVVRQPEEGPHEIRAVVADPAGNISVVYAPIP
ncbi:VOC family protein [Amycolatopsis methanolica]|uniref:VOC family protein n=1 Tax=Amycolatopsis methanolica TaxID=1814 RepID=UPI00342E37F0